MRVRTNEADAPTGDDERPPTWVLLVVAVVLSAVILVIERLGT